MNEVIYDAKVIINECKCDVNDIESTNTGNNNCLEHGSNSFIHT